MSENPAPDLDAYLGRIGLGRPSEPGVDALAALHTAHLATIPFENVDVLLGRPVSLDPGAIEAKLVRGRRGGYCFEHNTLFAAVLRSLGFEVETLEARVRPPGAAAVLPRTHMALCVLAGGGRWIADVGFGAEGPWAPVPLDGTPTSQADATYRVEREGDVYVLRRKEEEAAWRDLYSFSLTPALPVDLAVAHHFTATHPSSPFVRTLTVQRSASGTRYVLRGLDLTIRGGGHETRHRIRPEELPAVLRDPLGLDLEPACLLGLRHHLPDLGSGEPPHQHRQE